MALFSEMMAEASAKDDEIRRLRALVRKLTISLVIVLIAGTFQWLAYLAK